MFYFEWHLSLFFYSSFYFGLKKLWELVSVDYTFMKDRCNFYLVQLYFYQVMIPQLS